MKNKIKIAGLSVLLVASLASCGKNTPATDSASSSSTALDSSSSTEETGQEFANVSLLSSSFTYDGESHSLAVTGAPDGTEIAYSNNGKTEAGVYEVKAELSKTGYKNKTLTATLTITKAVISGLSFKGASFEYDSFEHSIEVTGVLPEGASVSYSCTDSAVEENTASESGSYEIKAHIDGGHNFENLDMTATLTIKATEKQLYSYVDFDTVYFQNDLDGDSIYSYKDSTLASVSPYEGKYFTKFQNHLTFETGGLFPSIKYIDSDNSIKNLYNGNAEYLTVSADGTKLYFVSNQILESKSGIFALQTTGSEDNPVSITKVYEGKAYDLCLLGNNLYFADKDKKLSRVSLSSSSKTMLKDGDDEIKVTELKTDGTSLFYTRNKLLGNYLAQYNVSASSEKKLTSDAAKYICFSGNDVYYASDDALNSALFGKGIYKVTKGATSSLPGTLVISATDKDKELSSLSIKGGIIYFYFVNNKHFMSCNLSSGTVTDLLAGFTPVEPTLLTMGGASLKYKNRIYFKNNTKDGCLFYKSSVGSKPVRVTGNKVIDMTIHGDTLYYNQVTYGVNNDLYAVNLKLGGDPALVSKNDCRELAFDGDKIYYTLANAAGAYTAIHKMKLDGTEDSEISSKGAYNLKVENGYLYYIPGSNVGDSGDITKMSLTDNTTVTSKAKTTEYEIAGGKIYLRRMYGLNQKSFASFPLDFTVSSSATDILTASTDPVHFTVDGSTVYYCNNVLSSAEANNGLWKCDTAGGNKVRLLDSTWYASSMNVLNGKLYFYNYCQALGDSHFYSLSLTGTVPERIDTL